MKEVFPARSSSFSGKPVIVLYHYSYYIQKRSLFKGHLAVDLLLVACGFVIAFAHQTRIDTLQLYAAFLRKRFARLYPLHALTLLFYLMLALAAAR
jgi:peptidoglycan/LPS O-acetylase OafA/YrhL